MAVVRGGHDLLDTPMSHAHAHNSDQQCKHCDQTYTEFYSPGFCSEDCYHREQGQRVLNNIQYDHCYCSNCGAQLKQIEKPPKSFLVGKDMHSANAIVGFQYRTPSADTGEIDVDDTPGRELVATGTVCGECGNANQSEEFPEDQDRHLFEYGQRILESLDEKRSEGVPVKEINQQEFFDVLVTSGELRLALGRAIE